MRRRCRGGRPDGYRDQLTGLATRRLFLELVGKEVAHARRGRGPVAVALLDLDRFQTVNDTLGTGAGDLLLRKVGQRLSTVVRDSDTLARYGDDEFAVVLTSARQTADLVYAAHRLQEAFSKPFHLGTQRLSVDCSLGLGVAVAAEAETRELLSRAAGALRRAKADGPGSFEVFDSSIRGSLALRLETGEELRRALRDRQLTVFYQPQIDLDHGRLQGAECMIRWRHPRRGLIAAGEFVPIAEEIGLMPELGDWLLHEICRQSARWTADGLPAPLLSVNLSVRQFQAGGIATVVEQALSDSNLPANALALEVTEAIALSDIERMRETLGRLHALGVALHLDDFGTGYSSLRYLLELPVDAIKIDRSFVAQLLDSEKSRAIVEATLAMADSLDLEVIAEGVETSQQLRTLAELGCHAAQGHLIARPLPAEEFAELIAEGALPMPGLRVA